MSLELPLSSAVVVVVVVVVVVDNVIVIVVVSLFCVFEIETKCMQASTFVSHIMITNVDEA